MRYARFPSSGAVGNHFFIKNMQLRSGVKFIAETALAVFFVFLLWGVANVRAADTAAADAPSGSATSTDVATGTSVTAPGVIDTCAPTQADLKQITAIKNDPTLSYSDEIKQELALSKDGQSLTVKISRITPQGTATLKQTFKKQ